MNRLLRKKDLSSPMSELLSTIVMVIVMWFGGQLVLNGNGFSAEEFIGTYLFSQIILQQIINQLVLLHSKRSAAAERVYEILDTNNKIRCK